MTARTLAVLLVLGVAASSYGDGAQPANPVLNTVVKYDARCPEMNGVYPTFLLHETDCAQYYMCNNRLAHLMRCPSNLLFNSKLNVCDHPDRVQCGQKEKPLTPEDDDDRPLTEEELRVLRMQCPQSAPRYLVLLPHPRKCKEYIVCDHNGPVAMPCPQSLHFNPTAKVCDFADRAGCKGSASKLVVVDHDVPQTSGGSRESVGKFSGRCPDKDGSFPTFFPHETDCSLYYMCSHGNIHLKSCPHNLRFNPKLNVCDHPQNVPCNPQKTPLTPDNTASDGSKSTSTGAKVSIRKLDSRCPRQNGAFPKFLLHESNCGSYYVCDWGYAILMQCPAETSFSLGPNVCIHNKSCKNI